MDKDPLDVLKKLLPPPRPCDYVDDFDDDVFVDAFLAEVVKKPAELAECDIMNAVTCRELVPYVGAYAIVVDGEKIKEGQNKNKSNKAKSSHPCLPVLPDCSSSNSSSSCYETGSSSFSDSSENEDTRLDRIKRKFGRSLEKVYKAGRQRGYAEGLARGLGEQSPQQIIISGSNRNHKRIAASGISTTPSKRQKQTRFPAYTNEEDVKIINSAVAHRLRDKTISNLKLSRLIKEDIASPRPHTSLYKRITRDLGERIEAAYAGHPPPQRDEDYVILSD